MQNFSGLSGLGKENGYVRKYAYVDYEPSQAIPIRYPANYREIRAWVLHEYGLKVSSPQVTQVTQVTQVKRKHGIVTQGGQSRPLQEGADPPEVPTEKEAAIEAALRHFRLL